jgi:hypothetical protein
LLLKVAFSAINSRHFLAFHLAYLDGCPDIWEHWDDVGWCAVCAEAILIFAIHIGVDSLDFSSFFFLSVVSSCPCLLGRSVSCSGEQISFNFSSFHLSRG